MRLDPRLNIKRLSWTYPKETIELLNTGYCWKAHVPSEGAILSGGPLNHDYSLAQYHCHWGEKDDVGSEHQINGQSYGAEIHFVNWNTKYGSFNEALKYGDGLAVLAVFLKVIIYLKWKYQKKISDLILLILGRKRESRNGKTL